MRWLHVSAPGPVNTDPGVNQSHHLVRRRLAPPVRSTTRNKMTADELFSNLVRGCQGQFTALRSITRLQPAGGEGDKAFPPTYADGTYAFETRMMNGNRVETVLLDSVQSQANRFEEVLLEAYRPGRLALPMFEMNIAGHETMTLLSVPHRVHDAIFRDSLWSGKPFRESEHGKRLVSARAWNATPFFEFAPTVLLFG